MYCKKLLNIIDHPISTRFNITLDVIKLLDEFLTNETGIILPEKINPIKFAIKHDVDDIIAVMCFVIGAKTGLFKAITYYNCTQCDEMHEVEDILAPLHLDCECETMTIPNDYRENVFFFFQLLFEPINCNLENEELINKKETPIDIYLSDLDLGKPNVSLAMVDKIVGKDFTNSLLDQRDDYLSTTLKIENDTAVLRNAILAAETRTKYEGEEKDVDSIQSGTTAVKIKEETLLEETRPTIFIGSSVENLALAYAIQSNLEHDSDPTVWTQGVFQLSSSAIKDLLRTLNVADFAVFVFSPDDVTNIRKQEMQTIRDNVVFEMGMFIGGLGVERTFFVIPQDTEKLHLPTDLIGIEPGKYNSKRGDGNLRAALGPVCHEIGKKMKELGKK